MKTIPIHPSAPEAPRLMRGNLLRYAHVGLALFAGGLLPALALYGFLKLYTAHHHQIPTSGWAFGFMILGIVVLGAHGVAKCSPMYALSGVVGLSLAVWLPKGFGYFVFFEGLSLFIGLAIAHEVYRTLRSRVSKPEVCAKPEELNPRCGTCHARSFCPYQPGGLADRYTPKA